MLYLGNRFGGFYIKCFCCDETNCKFKFADAIDRDNLIQIFEHVYVRHAALYRHITDDFDTWYKSQTVSAFS